MRELPDDWRVHASRGLALAGLGRRAEALLEARALERSIMYADRYFSPILDQRRALILAQLGMAEDALTLLEPLLRRPSWISVHVPRLDPRYDRIRNDPRFEALLAEFAEPQPVR